MIIHKLIGQHLKAKDDATFYTLQARDAIQWLMKAGVNISPATKAVDLGCGHGIFGAELIQRGSHVLFADEANYLLPELKEAPFRQINIDQDDLSALGQFDLVICSNVLEHLSKPRKFIEDCAKLLRTDGFLYLSWTNWLSPWGGHEFSPFHYLGPKLGPAVYDKVVGKPRKHTPYVNLFPISIGRTIELIKQHPALELRKVSPRYYPELSFIMSVPLLREFVAWNCALLVQRKFTGA